jgi:hypothetical protein
MKRLRTIFHHREKDTSAGGIQHSHLTIKDSSIGLDFSDKRLS